MVSVLLSAMLCLPYAGFFCMHTKTRPWWSTPSLLKPWRAGAAWILHVCSHDMTSWALLWSFKHWDLQDVLNQKNAKNKLNLRLEKTKKASCTGCRNTPYLMQLHQCIWAKSTTSVELPFLLKKQCNLNVFQDLECPKAVLHNLFCNWGRYL